LVRDSSLIRWVVSNRRGFSPGLSGMVSYMYVGMVEYQSALPLVCQ